MILDEVFEQKDEIAKAVSEELEKVDAVTLHILSLSLMVSCTAMVCGSHSCMMDMQECRCNHVTHLSVELLVSAFVYKNMDVEHLFFLF
jgi:hypothetical protein